MTKTSEHLDRPDPPVVISSEPGLADSSSTPITTLSSWSAPPLPSSRWRGVLITCGIIVAWLVLFLVLASPVLIDLWTSRSSATCDSPSSLSSSQSPSEIK